MKLMYVKTKELIKKRHEQKKKKKKKKKKNVQTVVSFHSLL